MPPVPRRCQINWIQSYSETVIKFSEAPEAYNVWSAISVVSAVLKKRCYVRRGLFKVYPNQYIVLVGPPGVGKGSAIHPAHDFIREAKPPLANYISDRVTAERIVELLAKGFPTTIMHGVLPTVGVDQSAVFMCSELQTFVSSSDWMLPFLCDLWDNKPFEHGTKNKGNHVIKDVCVSLIGACVPEFIRRLNKDAASAINGGFTARTIFVFATDKSKSLAWPQSFGDDPRTKKIADDLDADLKQIANLQGEFTFSKGAIIIWERAYHAIKASEDDSPAVQNFKGRQGVHIIKVAMCFAAATNDSMVIDDYCMRVAVDLVDSVLRTIDITFRGVGESPLAEATAKVMSYLERKGLATRAQILKDCYRNITGEDLDRVLWTLMSIEFCEEVSMGGKKFYKHLIPKGTKTNVNGNGHIPSPVANNVP